MTNKTFFLAFSLPLLVFLPRLGGAQEIVKTEWQRHSMNNGYCVQTILNIGAAITITVKDWHALQDPEVLRKLLSANLQDGMNKCPSGTGFVVDIEALNSSQRVIRAVWKRETGQWRVESATTSLANQEQAVARTREAAQEQERRQQQAREEKERITKAALADCGTSPTLSGGPWFSSTYKVAALDEAWRVLGLFLCIKSIEYISAAPNPYGGNAARAKFVGYDAGQIKPTTAVRDFAY